MNDIFVFSSGEKTNSADGLPTLEQATYNCQWEIHGNSRFIPHTLPTIDLINFKKWQMIE